MRPGDKVLIKTLEEIWTSAYLSKTIRRLGPDKEWFDRFWKQHLGKVFIVERCLRYYPEYRCLKVYISHQKENLPAREDFVKKIG